MVPWTPEPRTPLPPALQSSCSKDKRGLSQQQETCLTQLPPWRVDSWLQSCPIFWKEVPWRIRGSHPMCPSSPSIFTHQPPQREPLLVVWPVGRLFSEPHLSKPSALHGTSLMKQLGLHSALDAQLVLIHEESDLLHYAWWFSGWT